MRKILSLLFCSTFILVSAHPALGQEETEAQPDAEVSTGTADVDIETIEREIEGDSDVEEFEGREKIRADDAISLPSDI